MLQILEKIESDVICVVADKHHHYSNGKDAYQQLDNNYSVISISALNNQIIIQLEQLNKSTDKEWKEDYVKQFGEEPSFF